ncbi:hypothetical protein [Flavobacterium sp.]|uniref:hypothetical protein n=1 Tax=Flavobacterium sp. TaxID=239 RepID=UPI00263477B5|nr:hypothetical protein [Flavobacterium sp.]
MITKQEVKAKINAAARDCEADEEDRGSKLVFLAVILIVIACGVSLVSNMVRKANDQNTQLKLMETVSKTEAGKFAVDNFTSCKLAGGTFSSPPSNANCITETVNGAEKLKGREFGVQVTTELANWLDQSSKLNRN